jgi:hypothetical protein
MISVPIRYRRAERGQFLQKLQHAIPSVIVLGDGMTHLTHDPHGIELALGLFEVGAALAVMGAGVRGFRTLVKACSTLSRCERRSARRQDLSMKRAMRRAHLLNPQRRPRSIAGHDRHPVASMA